MKRALAVTLVCLFSVSGFGCTLMNEDRPMKSEPEVLHTHENHGEVRELGSERLGDNDVKVFANEWVVGASGDHNKGALEILVSGKDAEKLVVTAWVTDSAGRLLSAKAHAKWYAAEIRFICYVVLDPFTLKAGTHTLWVSVGDAENSWPISVK